MQYRNNAQDGYVSTGTPQRNGHLHGATHAMGSNYKVTGGGYSSNQPTVGGVSGSPHHMHVTGGQSQPDPGSISVYNPNYKGSTYSVKYLGIVDGTMGILSRKMALTSEEKQANPLVTSANKSNP